MILFSTFHRPLIFACVCYYTPSPRFKQCVCVCFILKLCINYCITFYFYNFVILNKIITLFKLWLVSLDSTCMLYVSLCRRRYKFVILGRVLSSTKKGQNCHQYVGVPYITFLTSSEGTFFNK